MLMSMLGGGAYLETCMCVCPCQCLVVEDLLGTIKERRAAFLRGIVHNLRCSSKQIITPLLIRSSILIQMSSEST